jgi:hypothetical protein
MELVFIVDPIRGKNAFYLKEPSFEAMGRRDWRGFWVG